MKKFKLTGENYYSLEANQLYLSVSQIKDFMECEAMAMAKINGEWVQEPTPAMLMGSYIDSWFEGTLDKFKENNPQIFKKDGSLKSDYLKVEEVIEKVKNDTLFMRCMSGEKQVIMTGSLYGAPVKIKMDSYLKDEAIVDLKLVKKLRDITYKNGFKQTFIEKNQYDLQLGVYQEIVRQNTGNTLDCIIAGADKQEIPDLDCILIPNDQLAFQVNRLDEYNPRLGMSLIQRILEVKNHNIEPHRCGICDYCRKTKKLERLILPDELLY